MWDSIPGLQSPGSQPGLTILPLSLPPHLSSRALTTENVPVTKGFRRVENAYHMEAELCSTFTEFRKMQNICNFIVEKLDSSVVISQPQFCYTPGSVENLRWQAFYNLIGQILGKSLFIKKETKEWEGQIDDPSHPDSQVH
ncbi:unnamed protein product [Nyctereutes procyonoides]|uniref:(raccoon dog) hypothetical protein n=1 Tax=Nyctereutes procyonoides TaxID=34880 RepID=A0A811ZFL5_NYCPR|nr:unnamed protein product [Nyctereutes procyonoides]